MIGGLRMGRSEDHRGRSGFCRRLIAAAVVGLAFAAGCRSVPRVLTAPEQGVIDRKDVEYPADLELREFVSNLPNPTSIAVEPDGSLLVAGGSPDEEPYIWRIRATDNHIESFYPRGRQLPFDLPLGGWRMFGPIGGMAVFRGEVYVSHRDENGFGVITAFNNNGDHRTVVAHLPAQGDFGVTDIAIQEKGTGGEGKLFFGIGTATNSGVVGVDNWEAGWVVKHPEVCDIPLKDISLFGARFNSPNPAAGLFTGSTISVTAGFQPFGNAFALRVPGARDGKANGVIMSISPHGGMPKVEAHGLHHPRGIGFDQSGFVPYFTDMGMEPRGTRPINRDPDALYKWSGGNPWYGWPDFSRDFNLITDDDTGRQYQPPSDMVAPSGYPQIAPMINLKASELRDPQTLQLQRTLLAAVFPWMAGAAKFQFIPEDSPFNQFPGFSNTVVVALSGDRLPFATGGRPLVGPGEYKVPDGFKLVIVDLDRRTVRDFIRNTANLPASKIPGAAPFLLERPCDIKFAGNVAYILDAGSMRIQDNKPHLDRSHLGHIYKLTIPQRRAPATMPASTQAQ
ncbi:MAG TPA: hypothetical protein VH370_04615 [Humisphaera sp.]|jgi:hypothetical protein|nr:hypothetical protein [Humisphaera sp.]